MTTQLLLVKTENVQDVWPQARPLIEKALAYDYLGNMTSTDALRLILNERQQLWILFDTDISIDGLDNDRDGEIDEIGEQIIMSKFVYYNNDWSVTGNPQSGTHIYNYLRGIWKDNIPMTYGGDGHGGGT